MGWIRNCLQGVKGQGKRGATARWRSNAARRPHPRGLRFEALEYRSLLSATLVFDDFDGPTASAANWYIPTWEYSGDGTYVGRTQFRCTQDSTLPACSNSNVIITVDSYHDTAASCFYGTDLISNLSFDPTENLDITVRAKMNTTQTGIVGGIYLYSKPGTNGLHNEVDFEMLTNTPGYIQTNVYANEPLGTGHPQLTAYPSGSINDYHTYEMRLSATHVVWLIDGTVIRTETTYVPTGTMQLNFDMWVPGSDWTQAYSATLQPDSSPSANRVFSMLVDWATVGIAQATNLGIVSGGYWYRDMNGDGQWTLADGSPVAFGPAGATPVTGNWDGSGKTEIGYYQNGTWYLMTTTGVEQFTFGFTGSGVIPVVGDWNGDGKTEVGVYCNGAWFRDVDGSHTWDATNQAALAYLGWNDGGTDTVIPVPGHWAGNAKTQMGVYCKGVWFVDSTGTNQWDETYSYWGWDAPLTPVAGNWSGSGLKDQFAVYSQGVWFRDADGTHTWDAANQAAVAYFGWAGAQPVVGDWNGSTGAARLVADSLSTKKEKSDAFFALYYDLSTTD